MRLSSRPRATPVQHSRSMGSSDNSHSSESAASPASTYSSNTSSGTHSASLTPLPKGAEPPRVNAPTIEGDVGFNPNAKRRARVLRKPYPPPSITNATTRNKNVFYTADKGGRPSSSARVRVNRNDTEFLPSTSAHHRRSLLVDSALAPALSYNVSMHSHLLYDSYESQAMGRSIPFTETAEHTDDTLMPSTSASERPLTKLLPVEDTESSQGNKQGNSRSCSSIMMQAPFLHRDKPLPKPPVLLPDPDGSASPEPIQPLPSHRLLQYRYQSSARHSGEGQAVPLFEHLDPRLDVNNSTGHNYERYAHSDIGHTQTWSDSGHTTSVTRYAHSDVHYHVSEPRFHHNPERNGARPHSPSRRLSTVGRLDSSFAEFPTPLVSSQTTHPMPRYPSEPPMPHTQGTRALARRLSWSQRIIRTLSITLFRKDIVVDETLRDLPSPGFDPGHDSAFHRQTILAHSAAPLPLQDSQPLPSSRKLRKRAPSHSNSLSSKPARFPTSMSTPALYSHNSRSRELVLEMDDPPCQEEHSDLHSNLNLSPNKNRSLSNPTRSAGASTPSPSLLRHSDLETSTPIRGTQSQPTTPTPSARKLVKRNGRRKIVASSYEEHQGLPLGPLRTQSPLNIHSEPPRFSDASRSHSVPNIGPFDPPSERFITSGHVAFPTQSPSKFPYTIESPVDEHSWLNHHHSRPSQSEDYPSLLHSRSSRRWTLAVFDAPEEQLVEELDRLRNVGWGPGFQGELVRVKSDINRTTCADNQEHDTGLTLEKEELEEWLVARKALMVCREIVRTEKSYREGLIKLQCGKTLDRPSPLLLQYLPALISASQAFSARLDDDPSAWGVSLAFLGTQDALEVALVAWSGVVGEFFGATTEKPRKRRLTGHISPEKEKKGKEKATNVTGPPALPSASYSDLGHAQDQIAHTETKNVPGSWRRSMPTLSQLLTSSTDMSNVRPYSTASTTPTAAKMPTVRDLAIQPTQRVMRYVLLYKDLLNSTPAVSPARGLVERALEGANHIAQRCNRAQDNAAFLT